MTVWAENRKVRGTVPSPLSERFDVVYIKYPNVCLTAHHAFPSSHHVIFLLGLSKTPSDCWPGGFERDHNFSPLSGRAIIQRNHDFPSLFLCHYLYLRKHNTEGKPAINPKLIPAAKLSFKPSNRSGSMSMP